MKRGREGGTGRADLLQRFGAETRHLLHECLFLLVFAGRFHDTAGLEGDLVAEDLEIRRRVSRRVVVVRHIGGLNLLDNCYSSCCMLRRVILVLPRCLWQEEVTDHGMM